MPASWCLKEAEQAAPPPPGPLSWGGSCLVFTATEISQQGLHDGSFWGPTSWSRRTPEPKIHRGCFDASLFPFPLGNCFLSHQSSLHYCCCLLEPACYGRQTPRDRSVGGAGAWACLCLLFQQGKTKEILLSGFHHCSSLLELTCCGG